MKIPLTAHKRLVAKWRRRHRRYRRTASSGVLPLVAVLTIGGLAAVGATYVTVAVIDKALAC